MYQKFTVTSSPETGAPRLAQLREAVKSAGLSGFLIPRADAHQGENVPPRDERLAWLTGFTGSAGFCAVLPDKAGVFVDGRYTLQVRKQIDLRVFTPLAWPKEKLSGWLLTNRPEGGKVGYDPMLYTADYIEKLTEELASSTIELVQTDNLIDQIWSDQPAPPLGKATPYPIELSGISSTDKRSTIANTLKENGLDATVLTLPDSIAWLLNIRGSDVANAPLVLSFAILYSTGKLDLFIAPEKSSAELQKHLGADITLRNPDEFHAALTALSGKTGVDKSTAPIWISQQLANPVWQPDPCILPKATKNPVELENARHAHIRDAAAMCEFLAWLDATPTDNLTEIDIVTQLETFRRQTNALTDISFDTICGSGPNGAIVHYRVDEVSNAQIAQNNLLLVDSGGQYVDGTTDITRTIAIGTPDQDMIRAFTLVLKGMISLSLMRWPKGTPGHTLDTMARAPLWQAGLDYSHGTGHGVGAYLSVHEGPASISPRGTVALETGMILSNEPGYYRENAWGVRIENLVIVEKPTIPEAGDLPMHSFETITFVPIDRRLIDKTLLSEPELSWLNSYHQTVLEKSSNTVSEPTLNWLKTVCAAL